jgi:two-component system OmpR family response regulator
VQPQLLIVEDDSDLREVLVRSLAAEGFAVEAVATGHELVESASAGTADAMVIDIGLPDSDGRDVCQALRARGVNTPILFLTARDALPDRLSGFTAGGDDYVTKPRELVRLRADILDPHDRHEATRGVLLAGDPVHVRARDGGR